jgi:hypothetical protein
MLTAHLPTSKSATILNFVPKWGLLLASKLSHLTLDMGSEFLAEIK